METRSRWEDERLARRWILDVNNMSEAALVGGTMNALMQWNGPADSAATRQAHRTCRGGAAPRAICVSNGTSKSGDSLCLPRPDRSAADRRTGTAHSVRGAGGSFGIGYWHRRRFAQTTGNPGTTDFDGAAGAGHHRARTQSRDWPRPRERPNGYDATFLQRHAAGARP